MPTLIQATTSSCSMLSPSKNLSNSTVGAPGRFWFQAEELRGSVSLWRVTMILSFAQPTFFSSRLEPSAVYTIEVSKAKRTGPGHTQDGPESAPEQFGSHEGRPRR